MGALALSHTAWLAAALAAAGACTGILAGLFGVGGGTVIIPCCTRCSSSTACPMT